jgi:catecholate siderophore receptor
VRTSSVVIAFTSLISICTAPAAAQSPVRADSDSVAGRRAPTSLEEVRVTAAAAKSRYTVDRSRTALKTDTPLIETPQAIHVVTAGVMGDQGVADMADVVRYMPGITMGQGEGHRDAPTIRGNSSTADFFIDGMRDDAQYLRDVYNVERVEAIMGPDALIFGRGGGGGVINRVTKQPGRAPIRELALTAGSFASRRATVDLGTAASARLAGRLNAVYEKSGSFRDEVGLERAGIDPVVALRLGASTMLRAGFEHFRDARTVDRGIPSLGGRPAPAPIDAFFGDPDQSHSTARVDAGHVTLEHVTARGLTLRSATRYTRYDKFYQNIFPRETLAGGSAVALAGYNSATGRSNVFNQTEIVSAPTLFGMRHTLLGGMEIARQSTDNFRRTAYFAGGATMDTVPFRESTVNAAVDFAQSATDADNAVEVATGSIYVQDQVELSSSWQAIAGVRYERFRLAVDNHRDSRQLSRADHLVSPRGAILFKPREPVSLYASYSVSELPSAGDQFSTLTVTTSTLAPERFTNYEIGAKWSPTASFIATAALYRLDRTNTSAKAPNDPSRTVQTGAQRSHGLEMSVSGSPTSAWQVTGAFTRQQATIVRATAAAAAGAAVPLVPRQSLSLWNRLDFSPASGAAAGVIAQSASYAAIDNAVTLPGFVRVDGAIFATLAPHLRAQFNVENLFGTRYYPTSQGNNNILPGAPRTVRLSLTTGF